MIDAEIITRRRKWTAAEKAALLAEVEAEGGRVKLVARRHGISESLIYNWRSAWKMAADSMRLAPPGEFLQIGVVSEANEAAQRASPRSSASSATADSRIEIDLPNGARVRVDELVSERALSRILRAVKGAL
jgi:transposase